MTLSSETLRRVAPHIPSCLKNLYSTHEDVEVGRCVQKFAGIPCTWNYEVGVSIVLYYHRFSVPIPRNIIHQSIDLN